MRRAFPQHLSLPTTFWKASVYRASKHCIPHSSDGRVNQSDIVHACVVPFTGYKLIPSGVPFPPCFSPDVHYTSSG
eukprot:1158104-Pelagomonas_calceolata.AAC.5